MEKKDQIITFRTDEETKKTITEIAKRKGWTTSETIEEIIQRQLKIKTETSIIIKAEYLHRMSEDAKAEEGKVVELRIGNYTDDEGEPEKRTYRAMEMYVLENGGLGCTMGFELAKEMTQEEIENT